MKKLSSPYPVVMVKGTNCSGKSLLVLMLRKRGWKEKVIEKDDVKVYYTRFRKGNKTVYVLGKYGEKGGGCDGLSKDEALSTLMYLWDKKGSIYFEGQNIADTLTTHPLWMLKLNGKRKISFEKSARGTLPEMDIVPERRRYIFIVCLDAPIELIMKRLARRTPGKVLKNNAAKTTQKWHSVRRQYEAMSKWDEVKRKDILLRKYDNVGKKKDLFNFFRPLLQIW